MKYVNTETGEVITDIAYNRLSASAKRKYVNVEEVKDDGTFDDFVVSAAIGAITGSGLVGGLLGGDLLGGIVGDALFGDDDDWLF